MAQNFTFLFGNFVSTDYSHLEECGDPPDVKYSKIYEWWISGIIQNITGIFGIFGNCISISILIKKSMRNLFHHLLVSLCFADLIFIISNMAMSLKSLNYVGDTSAVYIIGECICHFAITASVFLTMALTYERYQAVHEPYKYMTRGTKYSHWTLFNFYVVPSCVCALIFNIPRYTVQWFTIVNKTMPQVFLKFVLCYQVFHPLLTTGLIPLIILSGMNYRIYRSIPDSTLTSSRRRRAKHFRMARIAVALVILFTIFNAPRITIGIYEFSNFWMIFDCFKHGRNYYVPTIQLIADIFAQYFAVLNSSVNFVVYCMLGSQFQAEFLSIMGKFLPPSPVVIVEVEHEELEGDEGPSGEEDNPFGHINLAASQQQILQPQHAESQILTGSKNSSQQDISMVPCYSCDHQQSSLPCSSEHSSSASCHTDTSCRSCERPEAVCDGSVSKLPNVGPGKSMIPNTYNNQRKQVSKIKKHCFL